MKISVKKVKDKGRQRPWMVSYYSDGKLHRRFFSSREDAEQYARDQRTTVQFGGDPAEVAEAQRLLAGSGYKLANVVAHGLAALRDSQAAGASPMSTFADGIDRVIEQAKTRKRREATLSGYDGAYAPLRRAFGGRIASSITKLEVERYLESLGDRQGNLGCASIYTKRSVITHIKMALRAVGINNPLPGLSVVMPRGKDVAAFTNEQVLALLQAAAPNERGMVALALFAAIRPQTLERLPAECINLEDRTIQIPADISKDGYPHLLEATSTTVDHYALPGPPEVLWKWLEKYPFQPRPWRPLQNRLRKALGGFWIHDGLRHTGATNFRSLYGIPATANLLTHGSIALVRKHYAGITSRAKAAKFFALGPECIVATPMRQRAGRNEISWPSDAELAKRLSEHPAVKVARDLGCSGSAVAKRCRHRGIPTAGRGAWSKRAPH